MKLHVGNSHVAYRVKPYAIPQIANNTNAKRTCILGPIARNAAVINGYTNRNNIYAAAYHKAFDETGRRVPTISSTDSGAFGTIIRYSKNRIRLYVSTSSSR